MIPDEFIEKFNGKEYAETPELGAQCVYAYKLFCDWCGVGQYPTGTGWASGYWELRYQQAKSYENFDFLVGIDQLRKGDWCIWSKNSSCPYSHIAMFTGYAEPGYGYFFGQNQSSFRGFTTVKIRLDFAGVFRWRGWEKNVMEELTMATVLVNNLNIRRSPSLGGEVIGQCKLNQTLSVYGLVQADGYKWLQLDGGWIACKADWVELEDSSDAEKKIDWYLEQIGKADRLITEAQKVLRGES